MRGALGPATRAAGWLGQALPLSVKGARSLRHLAADPDQAYALKHAYGMFEPGREGAPLLRRLPPHAVNGYDAFAAVPRRLPRAARSSDPLDRVDVRRRADLHDRRRADEGRSHEHGGLARGARAAARSQAARVRGARAGVAEAEGRPEQVPAAPGARASACRARSSSARRAASPRRSASGCAARSRRWPTSCCSTAGCAIAASSTTAKSAGCGASIAAGRPTTASALAARHAGAVVQGIHRQSRQARPDTDLAGAAAVPARPPRTRRERRCPPERVHGKHVRDCGNRRLGSAARGRSRAPAADARRHRASRAGRCGACSSTTRRRSATAG